MRQTQIVVLVVPSDLPRKKEVPENIVESVPYRVMKTWRINMRQARRAGRASILAASALPSRLLSDAYGRLKSTGFASVAGRTTRLRKLECSAGPEA